MTEKKPQRILIVGPSWVGDMVMAQSLFKVIKQRMAESEITVLAPEWSEPVLQRMPEVDAVVDRFYNGEIEEFWPPEREHVETGYRKIDFPFDPVDVPEFAMKVEWRAEHLLNYLNTWSSVRRFIAAKGGDPVRAIAPELKAAFGEEARTVSWPHCRGSCRT